MRDDLEGAGAVTLLAWVFIRAPLDHLRERRIAFRNLSIPEQNLFRAGNGFALVVFTLAAALIVILLPFPSLRPS